MCPKTTSATAMTNADDGFTDANGRVWSKVPIATAAAVSGETEMPEPGAKGEARNAETECEFFQLFLDKNVIQRIVQHTNEKIFRRTRIYAEAATALTSVLDYSSFTQWFSRYQGALSKTAKTQYRAATAATATENALFMQRLQATLTRKSSTRPVDAVEIKAFVGIYILLGARHDRRSSLKDVFALKGPALLSFPAAATGMSLQRLKSINAFLAFTSLERETELKRSGNRIAKCFDVFEYIRDRFRSLYNPTRKLAVDEQLLGFRGKFIAIQYMPAKPDKYGIKIWLLVDSNLYVFNMQIYTGAEGSRPAGRERNQAIRVVMDMIEPLAQGVGYEITHDRFFTKLELASRALTEKGVTCLGTIRIDNRDIPPALKRKEGREAGSSVYAFFGPFTLLSYCPKPNKLVPLLSSRHPGENGTPFGATQTEVMESGRHDRKPRMILDYNATKGHVDTLDKIVKGYTAVRQSLKWYHPAWWRIVDMSAKNAEVLCNLRRRERGLRPLTRTTFLTNVGMNLIRENALRRYADPRVSIEKRRLIAKYHNIQNDVRPEVRTDGVALCRRRCQFCPKRTNNKSRYFCEKCALFACRRHAVVQIRAFCQNCAPVVDE